MSFAPQFPEQCKNALDIYYSIINNTKERWTLKKLYKRCGTIRRGFVSANLNLSVPHFLGHQDKSAQAIAFTRCLGRAIPVLIQDRNGMAKPYQVRQVLEALARLKEMHDGC